MQAIYGRYRDMKREIRDCAAVDIQCHMRGFMMRRRLEKFAVILPYSDPNKFSKGRTTLTLPRRGSGSMSSVSTGTGSVSVPTDTPHYVRAAVVSSPSLTTPQQYSQLLNTQGSLPLSLSLQLPRTTPQQIPHFDVTNPNPSVGNSNRHNSHVQPDIMSTQGVRTSNNNSSSSQFRTPEMYARYQSLLDQKKDIKKELKNFDEEFQSRYGRMPRKSDKEVCYLLLLV